jgi:hypothetical protein
LATIKQSGEARILDPIEAERAHDQFGLDLTLLEPSLTTDVYKGVDTSADETQDNALAVNDRDLVTYQSDICSSAGRYRFNIVTPGTPENPSQTMTLVLARDLHDLLLRKELLRKLGYKIPPIKYLPHVKVKFRPDLIKIGTDKNGKPINQRLIDRVLMKWLPDAADGNAKRWCFMAKSALDTQLAINKDYPCNPIADSETGGDPYTIELQDVVVMQATPVYYDVAMGPPIQAIPGSNNLRPEQMRIIRALSLPYGLLNLPESVNQYDWNAVKKDNAAITIHVTDQANFATRMDDALWMARKIAQLSRDDITQIVANSFYPEGVAKVVVEKMLSRRNSIVSIFGATDSALAVNPKVSDPPTVVDGKVMYQKTWPGYASNFSNGDEESPLKGIQYYILSELQANAMETLMNKVNLALPQLSEADAYSKHGQDLIQGAIQKYLSTGVAQAVNFGGWVGPLANGSVQISRDVVLGQYLGTNNLVQLADTFGFTLQAGILIGVDGLSATPYSLSGTVEGTVNLALTHLVPLHALKDSVTQPLEKEIVAWVFRDASNAFKTMHDQFNPKANMGDPTVVKGINNQLANDVEGLQKYLGPGESLIITASLAGDATVSGGIGPVSTSSIATNHPNLLPSLGGNVDMNGTVLSRIHFYRKDGNDSNKIVIYKDGGDMIGPTLSLEFTLGQTVQFPVISITAKGVGGSGKTKVFNLDINPDISQNPGIFEVAGGISSALRTGSTEVLESQVKVPAQKVSVDYLDGSSSMQLLHWVRRTLNSNAAIDVTLPDGSESKYVTLTNGLQTGTSYQSLGTQAASYLLQRLTNNTNYTIDTQSNANPGQTFFGASQTRDTELQGRLASGAGAITDRYVRIQYRWEGWDLASKDAQDLANMIADKYQVIYGPSFLGSTTDIKMYEVSLMLNIYEAGINQLMAISKSDEAALEATYRNKLGCDLDFASIPYNNLSRCAGLDDFEWAMMNYRTDSAKALKLVAKSASATKLGKQATVVGRDVLSAVTNLEKFADFNDLVKYLGGAENPDGQARIYISSQITGFREGAEKTLDPIYPVKYFGVKDDKTPTGIVDWIENSLLGIDDGEFNMKWLRSVL